MKERVHIQSVTQFHAFLGLGKPKHPSISIIRIPKTETEVDLSETSFLFNLFQISFYTKSRNKIKYGRNTYDFQEGTVLCSSPGQVFAFVGEQHVAETEGGWTIVFHPDLIKNTSLGAGISDYTFFSYDFRESLQLSEEERNTLEAILDNLEREITFATDRYSHNIIVSNLELFLEYCLRYYDRQFYMRTNHHKDAVAEFERYLTNYFRTNTQLTEGLPSVQFFADKINISANYLSDLLRKETGRSAQEHIHQEVLRLAKVKLLNSNAPVGQIAYELGFEYPQYFSKLFKTKMGVSPSKFRAN